MILLFKIFGNIPIRVPTGRGHDTSTGMLLTIYQKCYLNNLLLKIYSMLNLHIIKYFQDNRYKFNLRLYPTGKDEECRSYVSLFLMIRECPGQKIRFKVNFFVETTDGPKYCALNRHVVAINKGTKYIRMYKYILYISIYNIYCDEYITLHTSI